MPRQYTHITRAEFEAFLAEFAVYEEAALDGVNERVYKIPLPSEHHDVLIFSTIEGDDSRGHGEDAIRTVVWDWRIDAPVSGETKTLRIGPTDSNPDGWRGNLKPKIENRMASWRDYTKSCPDCGAPMQYRNGSGYSPFFGCSRYPDCEGTRDAAL